MRANRQEHDSFIRPIVAEAVFALWYATALLTDDKYYPEIAVYSRAATTAQVDFASSAFQYLGIGIRIGDHPITSPFDALADACVTAQITDEALLKYGLVFLLTHPKPRHTNTI